ncbi:Rgp1-domain-containing protein [Lasiosphaeria hispida]|uniref:Rgp1-domain-containing protein n=1 Tax=Lasiosphaeria hispida TaxID=260671 RepID=A0AAJ0H9Z6_9PEZI|nr:Rgp1-domain-containing protein [Lasiosphaeria hispida]
MSPNGSFHYHNIANSSSSTSSTGTSSNIRVYVRWQDQVVFAGEDVKCTITFKNTARPPQPPGSAPLPPKPAPQSSRHPSAEGRPRQPSPLHPGARNKNNVGLAPPSSTRGHRSTLSLTVPSAASRTRSGSIPWSPSTLGTARSPRNGQSQSRSPGHSHQRSVSIVSIGSVGGADEVQSSVSAAPKPQRPVRGHARASSLQIVPRGVPLNGPRSATYPPRLPNSQSSPLFHASYPPDRSTFDSRPSSAASTPRTPGGTRFPRASPPIGSDVLSEFKFPMTQSPASPALERLPEELGLMSPAHTINEIQNLPVRSIREQVPTINEHGVMPSTTARILSTTSIAGTPRSSGEFYSLSNNSSETLASEYVTQQPQRTQGGRSQPHNRRTSNFVSSLTSNAGKLLPESLMMGYAQVQGSFTLDGSLVNLGPFEPVKRKAVVGGQGGGVIGVETTKRDSGLLRGFGWGNFTSSIGELLGGGELSSIKEMRGIASSKSIPLLSTPQSILFVDLQLAPGESKAFEYSFKLPRGLPPTHRGKAMKISYSLVIGTQRPGGAKEQQVKSVDIPFRVLGSVNSHGEILGHDLMSPYIIMRDQARVQSVDDRHHYALREAQHKASHESSLGPPSTMNSFLAYLDELLSRPQDGTGPAGLLSPSAMPSSRRQSTHSMSDDASSHLGGSAKEAIDLAILRANVTSAGQQSANRFEIARNGRRVGVVMLARPAYRLGEVVTLAIDFSGGEVPCYAVHFALETAERVDASLALRSEASVHRVTRKVLVSASEAAMYARRVVFAPAIPVGATPEFVTSGVCLEWKIRVEFVVPVEEGQDHDQEAGSEGEDSEGGDTGSEGRVRIRRGSHSGGTEHPLLEEISRDDKGGLVLVAAENLMCESFEVAVPLRVYGAVCTGLERLERDEAMEEGLVV